MSTPRPTPETDAKASPHIGFYSCATVPADFARRLERERDESRAARNECERQYQEKVAEIAQLLSEPEQRRNPCKIKVLEW
jgi:hypothetical protein